MIIRNGLATQNYTSVECEEKENQKYNAPHHFVVKKSENGVQTDEILAEVNFQEGPIKEVGVNGVFNEDLILMVLARLNSFQDSEFACRENQMAINKLEECLMWLRKRTLDRSMRNVLGTYQV